ncbi:CopD family protein [Ectothiorhodospiraceae bacterium 2226]|nr:CopD family protein [Ectothiorhodospiraceae bacterium 2226]
MVEPGGFAALAWVVTAAAYLTALAAAGGALFLLAFADLEPAHRRYVRRTTAGVALLAVLLTLLQLPIQAGFLGGGTFAAARDPMLVRLVVEGALGTAVGVRVLGLLLIATLVLGTGGLRWLAAVGALLVAVSFTQVGHSLSEPRWALAGLLGIHVLAAAFWIGALMPLHRISAADDRRRAGALLERFGRLAAWVVGALVLAGVGLAVLLLDDFSALFAEPYGQTLMVKVALVALLLGFAAHNKLRLSPAVARGSAVAAARLRTSIRWEVALVLGIVVVTAGMTTFTSPSGT